MAPSSAVLWWSLALTACFVCGEVSSLLKPNHLRVEELRKQLMYPYPKEHLKKEIRNGSPQLIIQYNFFVPFFGFRFNYTWVSLFGVLQFSSGDDAQRYPLAFPNNEWPYKLDPAFIGPFFAHALLGRGDNAEAEDERPPGVYFMAYSNIAASMKQEDIDLQEAIRLDVQHGMIGTTDFRPKHIILVTWKNITFGGSANPFKTNTYQLMLATDEYRTYAIFNYQNITWTSPTIANGDKQQGTGGTAAYVGFNAGNGTRAFEYKPYSQDNRVTQLVNHGYINGHPGRHIFRIDELVQQGCCNFEPKREDNNVKLTISPESGHMLGGTIVNITGPCFEQGRRIKIKFHDKEVTCDYRNRNLATCQTPEVYIAGYIDVTAMIGEGSYQFKNKFYIENPMVATELVWFDDRKSMNELDLASFNLYWSKSNISYLENKNVQISLWGYRESGMRPELVKIRTLLETTNTGKVLIETPDLEDGWMRELKIGLIQVSAAYYQDAAIPLTATLWSRPIPLGWYFRNQWIRHYGNNWPETFCKAWEMDDARLKNFAHRVPRCPCTKSQALADKGRFAPDFGCDEFGNQECFGNQKVLTCFRSGQPSQEGGGQQCCYSAEELLVLNADIKEGGFPSRSHPFGVYPYDDPTKVPGLSHWYHDMSAFYSCCIWQQEMSDGCYQFKWRRASQDCVGYQPPNASLVFGDPHFITFDNAEYSFNGVGEFSLVDVHSKAHDLEVQARFEQYIDEQKGLKMNASIMTALVMKDNASSKVEVQLRPLEARWRYRLNILVDEKNIYFDRPAQMIQSFKGVTVYTPSAIKDQSQVVAMFQSGAGIEVIETNGYIAARIYLPKSFMNLTKGLMGNWSNNREDDLVLPTSIDGEPFVQVPNDNFEHAHRNFGLKWVVSDAGDGRVGSISHFYHEMGRAGSSYYNASFKPNYEKYPKLPTNSRIDEKALSALCGDRENRVSYQCRFDYITTQNKDLASSTQRALVDFNDMKFNKLKTIITCGALQTPMFGRKSTAEYKVSTQVSFECQKGYVLEGEPIRWCYAAGIWSWTEYGKTRCTPEDTYYGRQAGITTGVVLGVLIPCIIGGICLFGFIYGKGTSPSRNGSNWRSSNARSGNEVVEMHVKDKKGRIETDA